MDPAWELGFLFALVQDSFEVVYFAGTVHLQLRLQVWQALVQEVLWLLERELSARMVGRGSWLWNLFFIGSFEKVGAVSVGAVAINNDHVLRLVEGHLVKGLSPNTRAAQWFRLGSVRLKVDGN